MSCEEGVQGRRKQRMPVMVVRRAFEGKQLSFGQRTPILVVKAALEGKTAVLWEGGRKEEGGGKEAKDANFGRKGGL